MAKKTLGNTENIELAEFTRGEYTKYQHYTLYDRAIPYLVDGLKPSQRRILYTLFINKSQGNLKVSSATGLVLTLHPHGPASIESGIVNMAQDYVFSNNYPLIARKGYFGERMETDAAAARYIECKLASFTEFLLFDDLNQVLMVPNYDEKVKEPKFLLPKLPLMLLNGAEGIATGYSVMIPSFHHKDIIDSIISVIKTGKPLKIKPFIDGYKNKILLDKQKEKIKYTFNMKFEKIGESYYITELPRGFDAKKMNEYLSKKMESEEEFLKDYVDKSADNKILIELIFKRGFTPKLETVIKKLDTVTSVTPNYTLISDDGIEIFNNPEEIIELFTEQRLKIVKRRYELLAEETQTRIDKASEIVRFIKEQHYAIAEKKKDKAEYMDYLKKNKFKYFEYLADMPIYRMTKEEVAKRLNLINEDQKLVKEYIRIFKSKKEVENKLIEELGEVNNLLNEALRNKWKDNAKKGK